LDTLAANPAHELIRIGPPHDALQFDVIVADPGSPRSDAIFRFAVRYRADQETSFAVECELLAEDRHPS
jgi:hypothetical protein